MFLGVRLDDGDSVAGTVAAQVSGPSHRSRRGWGAGLALHQPLPPPPRPSRSFLGGGGGLVGTHPMAARPVHRSIPEGARGWHPPSFCSLEVVRGFWLTEVVTPEFVKVSPKTKFSGSGIKFPRKVISRIFSAFQLEGLLSSKVSIGSDPRAMTGLVFYQKKSGCV